MQQLKIISTRNWIAYLVVILITGANIASTDIAEVCPGEIMKIQCPEHHVITPTSAKFGRMEVTRCIDVKEFIGCQNDVLFLVDKWCSGRRECEIFIPNAELKQANVECLRYLQMYINVDYYCLQVYNPGSCQLDERTLVSSEGFLSSHVTDDTGCGSADYPWIISALSGQTVEIDIIDFGSEDLKITNTTSSFPLYGYVVDGTTRMSIRGDVKRKRHLLTSKTNQLTIEVLQKSERQRATGFILRFKKKGCPDLSPPVHAWYKRDGDQAVIGCEWSQKTWHLSCDGQSWSGVVGNCTEPATQEPIHIQKSRSTPPALWLVCVVSVAVVLMVIACVVGIVCIKKYRIKQDVQKSLTLQRMPGQGHYDLDPNIEMASMLYLPYKLSQQQQHEQQQQQEGVVSDAHRPTSYLIPQDQVVNELTPIRIWERPLPELPDKPLTTDRASPYLTNKTGRTPGDGDEAVSNCTVQESDTLQSYQSETCTGGSQKVIRNSPLLIPSV